MNLNSDRLIIEEFNGIKFIYVDFKGLKEKDMIDLIGDHLELTLQTRYPFILDLHDSYLTTDVMTHGKKFAELTKTIIDKGALIGVNQVKSYILKGVVFFYGVNYKSFNTKTEAIQFLTAK